MRTHNGREIKADYILAFLFAVLAGAIIAGGYIYYRSVDKLHRIAVEKQLSAISQLKVSELVQWRRERLADGNIFSDNAAFSTLVRRFFENPRDADARTQIQSWMDLVRTHYGYDRVRLLDARGVTRLSTPAGLPPGNDETPRDISEILQSGRATMKDFYRSEHDQHIYLEVMTPILSTRTGRPAMGILALRIDPTKYLYPYISRWPVPNASAETLLVRREGKDVLFLNELRFQKNTALRLRISQDRKEVVAVQASQGKDGIVEGIDYRGRPVVAFLRAVPDSPWHLVARMDISEMSEPLKVHLRLILVLICALLVIAGMCMGFIRWKQNLRLYRERYQAAAALQEEIVERKKAEEDLKASVREKELLLREIYHRTKNNMQVIIGFLNLQSANIEDEKVLELLRDTTGRIKAMALVHEKLYQAKNLSMIDLKDYTEDLAGMIVKSHQRRPGAIALRMDMESALMTIDVAIPCGLILYELISNAMKHAFPGEREGEIRIVLRRRADGETEIGVEDNGVGLPEGMDIRKCDSLGLESVVQLTEHQLRGRVDVHREGSTRFRIRFSEPVYRERI